MFLSVLIAKLGNCTPKLLFIFRYLRYLRTWKSISIANAYCHNFVFWTVFCFLAKNIWREDLVVLLLLSFGFAFMPCKLDEWDSKKLFLEPNKIYT